MKINTSMRDTRRMELNELKAIDKRIAFVKAKEKAVLDAQKKTEIQKEAAKTRKKKKEEDV